jgi:hypothetical protein
MKGFPTKFIELTRKVVENSKVNIMVMISRSLFCN